MGERAPALVWASDLARPVPLAAAAALAVNDHVLKGAGVLPAAVTGKLSDVAGLLAGGIAAVTLARGAAGALTGRTPRRDGRLAVAVLAAVGLGFAALKLWPGFNRAVAAVWGANVLDPDDLWALPVLALAFLWLRDRELSGRRTSARVSGLRTAAQGRFARGLALIGVVLACAATPAPPPVPPPDRAAWSVGDSRLELPCGEAVAWVSKSGKTGAGVTVRVTRREEATPCEPVIASATLRFRDGAIAGREIPVTQPPAGGEVDGRSWGPVLPSTFHYLAFEFDNQARWNRGDRSAVLELELVLDGERRTWTAPATHAYRSFPIGPRGRW